MLQYLYTLQNCYHNQSSYHCHHTNLEIFFLVIEVFKINSFSNYQLSNMQCNIDYSYYAMHAIPVNFYFRTESFYLLNPSPILPTPHLLSPLEATIKYVTELEIALYAKHRKRIIIL